MIGSSSKGEGGMSHQLGVLENGKVVATSAGIDAWHVDAWPF